MLAPPFGLGPFAMPLCLPYFVVVCGLSALPGRSLIRKDLSYGVYLMHAAVLTALEVLFPDFRLRWLAAIAIFAFTLALAWLSWTFVEGPALRRKKTLAAWLGAPLVPAKMQRV